MRDLFSIYTFFMIIRKDNQCHSRLQVSAGESGGDALRGKSGRVLRQIALRFASNRQPFCVKTHPDLRQNAPSFCVKSGPRFASNREKAKLERRRSFQHHGDTIADNHLFFCNAQFFHEAFSRMTNFTFDFLTSTGLSQSPPSNWMVTGFVWSTCFMASASER